MEKHPIELYEYARVLVDEPDHGLRRGDIVIVCEMLDHPENPGACIELLDETGYPHDVTSTSLTKLEHVSHEEGEAAFKPRDTVAA